MAWSLLTLTLLLLALLWLFWSQFNSRLVDRALDAASRASGLSIHAQGQTGLQWRPEPRLVLHQLRIETAAGKPLLQADRLDLTLPWSSLRGGPLVISRLELDAAQLDNVLLLEWLAARPAAAAAALPRIDRLRLRDGRWRHGEIELAAIELELRDFAAGRRLTLDLAAQWQPELRPLALQLELQARPEGDSARLRFEELMIRFSGDDPLPEFAANGIWQALPDWRLELEGRIAGWRPGWGRLPAPLDQTTGPIAFQLAQQGPQALLAPAQLRLQHGEARLQLQATPATLHQWWTSADRSRLPPLAGTLELPELELGEARLEGVRVELEP